MGRRVSRMSDVVPTSSGLLKPANLDEHADGTTQQCGLLKVEVAVKLPIASHHSYASVVARQGDRRIARDGRTQDLIGDGRQEGVDGAAVDEQHTKGIDAGADKKGGGVLLGNAMQH